MISLFELFKIGVGPSSSHTVGPMLATRRFVHELRSLQLLQQVARIQVELFGSLALTGLGHATDRASSWDSKTIIPSRLIRPSSSRAIARSVILIN